MDRRKVLWYGSVVLLGCLMSAGCGGGGGADEGIEVKGRLLEGGQPVIMKDFTEGYNYYSVTLSPAGEGGKGGICAVQQDGSFTLRGVKPGKFKVGVAKMHDSPDGTQDEWKERFSAQNSPMTIDVEPDKEVTIELNDLRGGAKAKR